MAARTDLVVVGGGPAGYTAALRAARRGLRVQLVERDALGGACLNRGCIPTKAMLHAASVIDQVAAFGGSADPKDLGLEFGTVLERRDDAVRRLNGGVTGLLRAAEGIEVVHGNARLVDGGVVVRAEDGEERYLHSRRTLVATGSRPGRPTWLPTDHPGLVDSEGALALTEVPERLVVVGGGPVGCEWASIFASFGSEVTLLEAAKTLLPREDEDLGRALADALRRQGIDVRPDAPVQGVQVAGSRLVVEAGELELPSEVVLVALGHEPSTSDLGLADLGVATDSGGFIGVDEQLNTNVDGVDAAGDVTGVSLLAHVAVHQASVVVDRAAGIDRSADYVTVPSVTYTHPEVASVGRSVAAAEADGVDVTVGEFPLSALGRAVATGQTEGFVRLVADAQLHRVVGMQAFGPGAGDLIAQGALAIQLEATLEDLADTIHAHPTFAEATWEAALRGLGLDLHVPADSTSTRERSR